jgi:MFS family permease
VTGVQTCALPIYRPAVAPVVTGWTLCLVPAVLSALHGGTDSVMARWAPTFYGEAFTQVLFPPAWVLSGYALAYFVGRALLSFLPEGRGERLLLIVPGLVGGGLLLAALACRSFGVSAALYVAASLLYGLEFPVLLGIIARRMPAHMGRTIALGGLASYALYGGLSVLVGAIAQAAGDLRPALLICPFGFIAFSLLAALWLKGSTCQR